jgi:hypothetical protein
MSGPWLSLCVPSTWIFVLYVKSSTQTTAEAAIGSTVLLITYAGGLFGSILVYRLFFHPLGPFPGPTFAKVSKLWHAFQLSNLCNHELLEELHQKYGEVVRISKSSGKECC